MIALVIPYLEDKNMKRIGGNTEFLGIQYIEASLKSHGRSTEVYNAHASGLSAHELVREIMKNKYQFLLLSCPSQLIYPEVLVQL